MGGRGRGRGGRGRGRGPGIQAKDDEGNIVDVTPAGPPSLFPVSWRLCSKLGVHNAWYFSLALP